MYQDDYLFFPEAQTVDKLLSLFNIQSQENLNPDKMISILGLLNLLNIVSVANDTGSNSLSQLVNNSSNGVDNSDLNSQKLNQIIQSLNSNQSQAQTNNLGGANLGADSNSMLQSITNMLNNSGASGNQLDPSLLLKLLNLFNQVRGSSQSGEEEEQEANEPVRSEPYEEEEE